MHSFTDCAAGVALGSAKFVVQGYFFPILEKWIVSTPLSPQISTLSASIDADFTIFLLRQR